MKDAQGNDVAQLPAKGIDKMREMVAEDVERAPGRVYLREAMVDMIEEYELACRQRDNALRIAWLALATPEVARYLHLRGRCHQEGYTLKFCYAVGRGLPPVPFKSLTAEECDAVIDASILKEKEHDHG